MWKLRFLPWFQPARPQPESNPVPDDHDTDGLNPLLREAFPRPEASEALRTRVAEICATAAATTPRTPVKRPEPGVVPGVRPRVRFALAFTMGALVIAASLAVNRQWGAAYAETAPTAGQLELLDNQGRATALCPLKHTSVSADISGFVARVNVEQEFQNPSTTPVEAMYTFPLPEDAAVDAMTMTVGDRVIEGEIKRREEARQIYEEARDAGQTAALLDQERPNIFTQSVANLMPGQTVKVRISYVNLLKYEQGSYEFVYPMVVGPRYIPGGSGGGYRLLGQRGEPSPAKRVLEDRGTEDVVTDAERITPPIAAPSTRAGHNISITVHVDAGVPLGDVNSVLQPVRVEREGERRATIALQNQESLPNKDFILRYGVAGDQVRSAVLAQATGNGSGYFTMIVQPPVATQADRQKREIVFVIDQSGSQSGQPIRRAKALMSYLVKSMNPDDTFQLLGFSNQVNPCFAAPVPNTPENVARALRFLEPIEGNGGTELLPAMEFALQNADAPDRRRLICFLTDGYVGNDMQILAYLRQHRDRAHLFSFGIGNGVNRFLIEGMAKEGQGEAEILPLNDSGEGAAKKFYRRVAQPLLVEVGVDWNGLQVEEIYPKTIPDLFVGGRPIILKGRYTQPGKREITLRGALEGKPWSQTLQVDFPAAPSREMSSIPTLWAREKIEELMRNDWQGAQYGNPNPAIKEQVVQVALEHRLMSQYTSFVAVEKRVVNPGGRQRFIDVPVEMPAGVEHDGIFGGEGKDGRLLDGTISRQEPEPTDATSNMLSDSAPTGASATPTALQPQGYSWPNRNSAAPVAPAAAEGRRVFAPRGAVSPGNSFGSQSASAPVIANPVPHGKLRAPESVRRYKSLPMSGKSIRSNPIQESQSPMEANPATPLPRSAAVPMGAPAGAPAGAPPSPSAAGVARQPVQPQAFSRGQSSGFVSQAEAEKAPALRGDLQERRAARPEAAKGERQTAPEAKLAPALRALLGGRFRSSAGVQPAEVRNGRVEIQVWGNRLTPDALRQLKALGFELVAELKPGVLVFGTAPVERLLELAALPFVRWIEPPKYR